MVEGRTFGAPEDPIRSSSPRRLMWATETQVRFMFGQIEVSGRENLEALDPNIKVIFATTHISDNDVPIAVAVLGHDFDVVVSDMSIHASYRKALQALDPTIIGMKIAGKDNFLPISHSQEKEIKRGKERKLLRKGKISTDDAIAVKAALESGKAVVIAAHNRSEGVIPASPGYLAIRAAQITENAVIVPIAVQIGEPTDVLGLGDPKNVLETRRKRPDVKVTIGQPLRFDATAAREAGDVIEEVWDRNQKGARQAGDAERLGRARRIFRQEGAHLVGSLANMLPPEKRGTWKEIQQTQELVVDLVEPLKSITEEEKLVKIGQEFVSVTDEMVERRHARVEELMDQNGFSLEVAFENPHSEDAKFYFSRGDSLAYAESDIATHYLGWDISTSKKGGKFIAVSPGVAVQIVPFYNETEGKNMNRYDLYGVNEEGKITLLSIEHESNRGLYSFMTDENWTNLRGQADAGINNVPISLKRAEEFLDALKVAKRWVGKNMYGIEPQPDEPV